MGGRSSGFHSVNLPVTKAAKDALRSLKKGGTNFVALKVSKNNRDVDVVDQRKVTVASLNTALDADNPAFYFYKHAKHGVFGIYCCPENAPLKNRMVYSTTKAHVFAVAEDDCDLDLVCHSEAWDLAELSTEQWFERELHPEDYSFAPTKKAGKGKNSGSVTAGAIGGKRNGPTTPSGRAIVLPPEHAYG